MKITMKEFESKVVKEVRNEFPDATVSIETITDKNDVTFRGLVLIIKRDVLLNLNLEEYYDMCDKRSVAGVIEEIKEDLRKHCEMAGQVDIFSINRYEEIKDYLSLYVMNSGNNLQFVREGDLVFMPYLDLMLGIIIYFPEAKASIRVSNKLLKFWGVSMVEVFSQASKNTQRDSTLEPLLSVLKNAEFFDEEFKEEEIAILQSSTNDSMYILSNKERLFGAALIANTEALQNAGEVLGSDYYILPSSINELILCKCDDSQDIKKEINFLKDMVRNANDTMVMETEILSYNVYKYFRNSKTIAIL